MKKRTLSLMRRLLPLPFLALAAVADAGHWETTYTGGYGTFSYTTMHFPYSLSNGQWGGGGNGATGSITATLTWTKDFPSDASQPPSEVYVKEYCKAAAFNLSGFPFAYNDLNCPAMVSHPQYPPGSTGVTSEGYRVTKQTVSNGTVVVGSSPQASGAQTASVLYSAEVTSYAVGIVSDRDVSYYAGDAHGRVPNDVSILTPRNGDTVALYQDADGSALGHPPRYICSPTFSAVPYGFASPSYQWSSDVLNGSGTSLAPTWTFSTDDVQGWIPNGGPIKVVSLTVIDSMSSMTATALYNMRLHAPEESIYGTKGAMDYTTAYVDSQSVTIPYGGVSATETYEFSSKVTVSASLSGGVNFSPAGLKWITANLGFSVSGSAEISYKRTLSATWTAPMVPNTKRRWWWRRRGKYDHCTVDYDTYDFNGYVSHHTATGTTFHSPDATTAAANDYDDEQMYEDLPL